MLPEHIANGHARTLNAVSYSYLIARMVQGPFTKPELMEACGLSELLVLRILKQMRERGKSRRGRNEVLHISGWHPDPRGHMTIREYRLGPGKDMPQPIMSRREIVERYTRNRKLREAKHQQEQSKCAP